MNTFTVVMLVVTIITGPDKQNVQHKVPMPDLKTCWEEAEAFMNQYQTPATADAKGLSAACMGKLAEEHPS